MSSEGELYEDAMRDTWFEQLYEEHAEQARAELRSDLLRSYYAAHPDIGRPAFAALEDARTLREISPAATLVRATTAAELGVKNLLLRPIVHGLVHSESLASAISQMVMSHQAVDRYEDLLVGILEEFGGINLRSFVRPGARVSFWEELKANQGVRNGVVHRGEVPTTSQRDSALAVSETILELLFPEVVGRLGFHLHGPDLCDDPHLSYDLAKALERLVK